MIATLATMQIGRGLALVLTGGSTVSIRNVPGWFTFIGTGMIGPIPFMIVLFIVTVVVMDFLMRKNQSFRKIYYIGSNENSARLSGISVFKHRMLVYIACSLFATVAGIITTSRFSVSSPTSGEGAEMTAIAAAVIGGASTNGGEGTVFGSLLGLILLNLITNALVLLNVSVYWQKLITGIILLLAVFIDFITHSLKNKK